MANFARFMIAQNPMADPEAEYVLHTHKPRFLAKRVFNSFEIADEIDSLQDYKKMDGLMRRLNDWYLAYQKWKEGNCKNSQQRL